MIFISHSSKDHEAAVALHARLIARSYDASQLFLDSDVDSGITAGESWQQILYARLKDCRALIVVCTQAWLDSKWCFAELVYAKASGKEVFPVIVEPCDFGGVLAEHQAVFVHRDGDAAYERLWRALDARHLGPRDDFGWPPKDDDPCPFPGLLSFDERHAGVYFGREAETQSVLEELRKMRANGEPRLLMITGGSGSGKSSLLKAGVLPHLRHKSSDSEWLVLPVLRYGRAASPQHTVFDQLAMDVARTNWKSLRDSFSAKAFIDAVQDRIAARGSISATALLPIDQFEELLAPTAGADANVFLGFMRDVFGCANGRLVAIGTMRSDHLDVYERHPSALTPPYFQSWRLGPFPRDRVRDVIVKPAARAHVEVAPDLLERLERDTPSAESLPLLAFTLEKLYRRGASDGRLDLHEYDGLEGAIEKSADAAAPPSLPADVLAAVRLTFVKHLASINDKDEVVRVIAQWSDVPDAAKPVLERFVAERLLTKNEHGVEVAHEALFRAWPTLRKWLSDAADILRWRRDVQRDRASDPHWNALRPAQLAVARPWLRTRRNELTDPEVGWIRKSIRRERTRRAFTATVIAVVLGFAVYAFVQKREAERASQSSLGKYLASRSAEIANTQPRLYNSSLLLAIEAYRRDPSEVTSARLRSAMAVIPLPIARLKHDVYVSDLEFSPDGRWLATSEDGKLRVWDFANQRVAASIAGKGFRQIFWRPDGAQIASRVEGDDGIAFWNWRTDAAPVVVASPKDAHVLATGAPNKWLMRASDSDLDVWKEHESKTSVKLARFRTRWTPVATTPDGDHIATVQRFHSAVAVLVSDTTTGHQDGVFVIPDAKAVTRLAFHPDGRALAIASTDEYTRIWDWKSDKVLAGHWFPGPREIAFSPEGTLVAQISGRRKTTLEVWHTFTGENIYTFDSNQAADLATPWIEFLNDGGNLIAAMGDGALRLFSVFDEHVVPLARFSADAVIVGIDVNPDGTFVAAGTTDGWVTVWALDEGDRSQRFPDAHKVVVAAHGNAIAVLGAPSRIVEMPSQRTIAQFGNASFGSIGVFSLDGQSFACEVEGGLALTDLRSNATRVMPRRVPALAMRFSRDGTQLFVAGRDGVLSAIAVASGHETRLLKTRGHFTSSFSADGRYFAEKEIETDPIPSGKAKTTSSIHLYDVARRKHLGDVVADAYDRNIVFSPDGTRFVSRSNDASLTLWSTDTKARVLDLPVSRSSAPPLFDPSGRIIATASGSEIQLFDPSSGEEVRRLPQLGGDIVQLAFTPDGAHLAAVSQDDNVRIWHLAASELVMEIPNVRSSTRQGDQIAFTSDGKFLVTNDERLILWRPDDVLREACRRASRKSLSTIEWNQFLGDQPYRETCSDILTP